MLVLACLHCCICSGPAFLGCGGWVCPHLWFVVGCGSGTTLVGVDGMLAGTICTCTRQGPPPSPLPPTHSQIQVLDGAGLSTVFKGQRFGRPDAYVITTNIQLVNCGLQAASHVIGRFSLSERA